MPRTSEIERETKETRIRMALNIDGGGKVDIDSGIPFFDHMLSLFAVHGFFDLTLTAKGDIEVDLHHTVEDIGLVLGDCFNQAMGDRSGIRRFGFAATPMDDTLAEVHVDLSNRPFLVYQVPFSSGSDRYFNVNLAKEFFRAFAVRAGMNLHISIRYGENEHHMIESIFKSMGRAMEQATGIDERIMGVRSTKGAL